MNNPVVRRSPDGAPNTATLSVPPSPSGLPLLPSVPMPIVRTATDADIGQLVNLQFEVYPPPMFPPQNRWRSSSLERHQAVFPEGQLVLELDGRVCGAATTMVGWAGDFERPHRFKDIIGTPRLGNHRPTGDALYGVDILVSPHFRGQGLGRLLYDARFALQQRLGLQWFYAGARVPGFGKVAHDMGIDAYLDEVRRGSRNDPTLSMQMKMGFEPVRPLPRYLPDPETKDFAILIRRTAPLL